jgi:hypothetical protein
MTSTKPILITGSHRSGSTWVGKMIAEAPSVIYIHEPFNKDFPPGPGICSAKFENWFTYVTHENESNFYKPLKNTIELRYDLFNALRSIKSKKDIKYLKEYVIFFKHRLQGSTPIIKDPLALFSAEWLAERFNMNVVVLIRHPAAFVSSLKKKGWKYSFSQFLEQPLLLKNHLYPFEAEIREYTARKQDIVNQAILLWRIIHYMIIQYQEKHKDWIFIRHEDISRDPLQGFQTLFSKLNLEFSEHAKEVIKQYSSSENPREAVNNKTFLMRNSELNIWNWRDRLASSEVEKVRNGVEDVSKVFYSDQDW